MSRKKLEVARGMLKTSSTLSSINNPGKTELEELEALYENRFSDNDPEFREELTKVIEDPPIINRWVGKSRRDEEMRHRSFDNQQRKRRYDDRDNSNRYQNQGRDNRGGGDNRDNRNRGNNSYNSSSSTSDSHYNPKRSRDGRDFN